MYLLSNHQSYNTVRNRQVNETWTLHKKKYTYKLRVSYVYTKNVINDSVEGGF